ncbi:hypothetical protein Ngar_c24270 [Candidatus Nitrososphaera gargensis Ga9.2]|uniref:Uncharacterized protein n=1 Tax=Nitrososphaera gargensis (strain Ga9.2) TaxID=1237085 RepID=K0ID84_NITGG|nr:hypothetical protein [Candidatus Nitrososphaera gargensis]AFU59351.1 hypothetical protein Ngar_c24270 [Candidatus Nitrososphaera gargensis Ga9.2]
MEFDPELIVMQAASTEPDTKAIEDLMGEVLMMAHAEESAIHISSAEQTFGWNFYIMSVDKEVARQLAQLPESGLLAVRGDSLEQKFVGWLNRRAKAKGADGKVHFNLLSDLNSSRYGLF